MSLKNGIFAMLAVGLLSWANQARAVVFPDQAVVSATAAQSESEDENADTASTFGNSEGAHKRRSDAMVARPLAPISDASFETNPGRAPASVGGRGPAMEPAHTAQVKTEDVSVSKKAVIRHAKQSKAYQEVAVIANDLGFFPSTVFVTQGIPVRMYVTGASSKSQCFMLDQFGVKRQIRNQKIEEITFTPDQNGSFSFHCPMNGAKGTMVVKELEVTGGRVPASFSVSHNATSGVPVEDKKSDINEDDFTPEFRNE